MTFDAAPALESLRNFQQRTVEHVVRRLYDDPNAADAFLVADETGLGKSMVARGVIAKVIERLDKADSNVKRIDIVYVCSNADLAKQNLARLNVTGQRDIVQSGRLTLLPLELDKLNGRPGPYSKKRINFISLTPGTSFATGNATGQQRERAVLFRLLETLDVITVENFSDAIALLSATASKSSFRSEVQLIQDRFPDGFKADLRRRFRTLAHQSGNLTAMRRALRKAGRDGAAAVVPEMRKLIGSLRSDLARAGLDCLEPDLIILDEFQRFRDLLYRPEDAPADESAELAREFLNYNGAKLLLLSATPYKAHTAAHDPDGDDHASDFMALLGFLSKGDPDFMVSLARDLNDRRLQLMGQTHGDGLKKRIEHQLTQYMCRTERRPLGPENMLQEIHMAPTDVRAQDLQSYMALSAVFREGDSGSALEYWKSIPLFANFLGDYKVGRVIKRSIEEHNGSNQGPLQSLLPTLHTLDTAALSKYRELETDSAKFRALRDHTTGQDWWQLLWLPPSMPYLEPGGPYVGRGQELTKQLVFSAWNATPTSISTLLSYDAERRMMARPDDSQENSAEARKRFRGRLRYSITDDQPASMSTLALFVPHAALAALADPLIAASGVGQQVTPMVAMEAFLGSAPVALLPSDPVEEGPRGLPASYFSVPGALPPQWAHNPGLAERKIAEAADDAGNQSMDDGGLPDDSEPEGPGEHLLYLSHIRKMLDYTQDGGWKIPGLAELAMSSPANCVWRALGRIVPAGFDPGELWSCTLLAVSGLRTLFNRIDTTELLDSLYQDEEEELDYWEKVLRYCRDGNLQAVLDEYVFQLRSQLPPGAVTALQLKDMADDIRRALSIKPAQMLARHPGDDSLDVRMRSRFAVRYSNSVPADGDATRMPDVRRSFNSPFWPFVLTSTSVGQEGIDFHWWAHSVIHWNTPGNPVDLEQREGRVHRYLGHAVRKNVATAHSGEALKPHIKDPWQALFNAARDQTNAGPPSDGKEFAPEWLYPGPNKIQRRLMDHPLSRDMTRTRSTLSALAKYRLLLGQARQDDLIELIADEHFSPLDLRP